jgi:hypothetical protein
MNLDLAVTGGVGGIGAHYDDMHLAAAVLVGEGDALDTVGRAALSVLDSPDLLASALLCPRGAVAAQAQLLAAVVGPAGLAPAVMDMRVTGMHLEAAADTYAQVERFLGELTILRRQVVGVAIGVVVVENPAVVALGGAAAGAVGVIQSVSGQGGPLQAFEDHPWLVDEITGTMPGLIDKLASAAPGAELAYTRATGRAVNPRTVEQAVGLATPFLPDGRGHTVAVTGRPAVAAATGPERAARSVGDMVTAVHRRSAESAAIPGLIGVRERPAVGGHPRVWVVELAGTQSWALRPGSNPRDLTTNLHTIAGGTTAYQQAVVAALRAAKVPRTDPVMLVGHSQGGLTAAALAADPRVRAEFRITHVITTGAPVAGIATPPDVAVLSLENRRDPVPRVEAAKNPPTAARTTVVFDAPGTGMRAHHSMQAYLVGAREVDAASGEPSVRAFLDGAQDFLGVEAPAVLHRYQALRAPD